MRAPLAAARITSVDVAAAAAAPGVVAVLTAAELDVLPIWEIEMIPERHAQPPLARDEVRYAGERVVAVVAESLAAALDAAELVVVDYEPRPAVTDARRSVDVALEWVGDAPDAPLGPPSVALDLTVPRLSVAPLEGHAVVAVPEPDGHLTVHVSTQVPNPTRVQLARSLRMDPESIRVVVPAVGGGFGGKAAGGMADHVVVAAAARLLGRPVRYVEDRAANLVGMQGRGVHQHVELHAHDDGRLTGLRASIVCDSGAYPSVGAVEPGKTRLLASGPYRIPVVDVRARSVTTSLAPTGAYRGPGRSEAAGMLERAIDVLAADRGLDPIELRRRNLVTSFPHRTATGVEYDSGDFGALLDVLVDAGYRDLRAEQVRRRAAGGTLLGIGVALVVDSTAWFARTHGARVEVTPAGTVVVTTGTASAGQHHDVAYRAVVQALLPVADDEIVVVEGDTDAWGWGDGTMGSRSAQLAGTAISQATAEVVATFRQRAADELEAAVGDVVFHAGAGFGVRGVPSRVRSLAELAEGGPVGSSCVFEQSDGTYPSAAHLSVVEIDPETGRVRPVRHVAVTDAGRLLDPPSARGQVIGATVQGIAQALYEEAVHDVEGNPRTASFADYGIPSSADVPPIETHFLETPTPRNPLGAKGIGEIGMIAAPAAVLNAVVDGIGVRHLDLPATPERVWATLARKGT